MFQGPLQDAVWPLRDSVRSSSLRSTIHVDRYHSNPRGRPGDRSGNSLLSSAQPRRSLCTSAQPTCTRRGPLPVVRLSLVPEPVGLTTDGCLCQKLVGKPRRQISSFLARYISHSALCTSSASSGRGQLSTEVRSPQCAAALLVAHVQYS